MKRSPLNRYTPLKQTTGLKRTGILERAGTLTRTPFKPGKSERQIERDTIYYPIRDAYMAAHPQCEFPGCCCKSEDPHHMAGKIGFNYYRHIMALCRFYHAWIHGHTVRAREMGYLIRDDPRRED